MRNTITGLALALATLPAAGTAGPLTNVFVNSLGDRGAMEWSEGYQEGQTETLQDVIVRMENGRRIDIGTVELGYEGSSITIDAENVRLNPDSEILLLKADDVRFQGGRNHLGALWDPLSAGDVCAMTGPRASLEIDGFGLILAATPGTIEEDSKIRIDRIALTQKSTGSDTACSAEFGASIESYEARMGDGSSTVAESVTISATGPGSLASLAADRTQPVTLSMSAENATSLIYGGATAWAIERGVLEGEYAALGLVPALTETLKYRGRARTADYWMRLWNSLDTASGTLAFDIDGMTIRAANVMPPASVPKLTDVGLTTMFLSTSGKTEMSTGRIDLTADMQVTGLFSAALDARLGMSTYPDSAIAAQARAAQPELGNLMLPVHVEELRYDQEDDGLIDALSDIMGVPVTVRINQIREMRSAENTGASAVIREIATDVATFAAISYRQPPARLVLSVIDELDLREAIVVSGKAPGEILNIFDYQVGTGAQ